MINKYKKKPVIIEAVQYTGDNDVEILNFIGDYINSSVSNNGIVIKTLEGNMTASKGDYIIKGIKGEFYPCKPDIFNNSYEQVN